MLPQIPWAKNDPNAAKNDLTRKLEKLAPFGMKKWDGAFTPSPFSALYQANHQRSATRALSIAQMLPMVPEFASFVECAST